jgi:hypothetical protein
VVWVHAFFAEGPGEGGGGMKAGGNACPEKIASYRSDKRGNAPYNRRRETNRFFPKCPER